MSFLLKLALFLPAFLAVEIVAALPGSPTAREALVRGVRNYGRHVVLWTVSILAFHLFSKWIVGRGPLW